MEKTIHYKAEFEDCWGWGYETLTGPDGFRCRLTEREDRSFFRDLEPVVNELNRLREKNAKLRRACADRAVEWAMTALGPLIMNSETRDELRDVIEGKEE